MSACQNSPAARIFLEASKMDRIDVLHFGAYKIKLGVMRYEELMDKLRNRNIKYDELEELKEIVEGRIRTCKQKEECNGAIVEHLVLKIVEGLMEKY